ncbi:MAG: hypothetical protein WEF86_01630 [Gemmatimonadota bacterium]
MKIRILGAFLVPFLALGLGACTAEQTEEGDLPDIDVEGGNLPEYDVDAVDVEIGTDTSMIITPDLDIRAADDTTGV